MTSTASWLDRPPEWRQLRQFTVYHGTTQECLDSIKARIDPGLGQRETDFGAGFYVTTRRQQARRWAWERAKLRGAQGSGSSPYLLTFDFDYERASRLDALCFVDGSESAEAFWSFVFHCRTGANGHGRTGQKRFFDLVYGPVAAFWQQRVTMHDADQISFHSEAVNELLQLRTEEEVVPA